MKEKFIPKLFIVMKGYSKKQLIKDIISGIIVAIIALPLSIALALASGVAPEQGLYTAIVAGFVISFLGGSRVQIAGPTAAFATIVAGIVAKNGLDGLIVATILAGIILIVMGLLRLGNLIRFIPYTITTGFTFGIAVTIVIGQLKDFFGPVYDHAPVETMEKVEAFIHNISGISWPTVLVGVISLAILIVWPKVTDKIPGSLIAVIVGALFVKFSGMEVNTIGDLYDISNKLPTLHIPGISMETVRNVFGDAVTIALLAGIESLLSCVVADGMIGSRHNSNMELVAQGAGNVASALFGGIPATGAIARTAANIKNGGRTPIAGMVHAVILVLILVIFMPLAKMIPMPTMAAILFMVAYNMSEWREFVHLCKTSPKSDILVLVLTFGLTVFFDLVVAIEVGILLSAILFMKRMADVADVQSWKYVGEDIDYNNDPDSINLRQVPKDTLVYEITGPMFFAASDKFMNISTKKHVKVVVLRMRSVPAMDVSAMHSLFRVLETCKKKNITLVLSHVQEQPMHVMEKAGFDKAVGLENFLPHIDEALARAEELVTTRK